MTAIALAAPVAAADGVVSPGLTGSPVWAPSSNRPDCLWAIYATADERDAALFAGFRTWAALEDRSVLLNYALLWRDVNGFGLELTTADFAGRHGHVAR
jgi:hypothetical protein